MLDLDLFTILVLWKTRSAIWPPSITLNEGKLLEISDFPSNSCYPEQMSWVCNVMNIIQTIWKFYLPFHKTCIDRLNRCDAKATLCKLLQPSGDGYGVGLCESYFTKKMMGLRLIKRVEFYIWSSYFLLNSYALKSIAAVSLNIQWNVYSLSMFWCRTMANKLHDTVKWNF